MTISVVRAERRYAEQTKALFADLRASAFGVCSPSLHAVLVEDALARRTELRVAIASDAVVGAVLAAPRRYWRTVLLRHGRLAVECARARWTSWRSAPAAMPRNTIGVEPGAEPVPPLTWQHPGDAWRIIIVGTASTARRRGIAAQLYRAIMAERSLVARIAADNAQSIELHRSLGWRLYPDGNVVLAVHLRGSPFSRSREPSMAV